MSKAKQMTLFGKPVAAIVTPKTALKTLSEIVKPDWFPADYWATLSDIEKHIHIIAYKELGSSYTVESTQSYVKWRAARV